MSRMSVRGVLIPTFLLGLAGVAQAQPAGCPPYALPPRFVAPRTMPIASAYSYPQAAPSQPVQTTTPAARPATTVYGAGASGAAPSYYNEDYPGPAGSKGDTAKTARIRVRVPTDAELWIDGEKTRQRGAVREFVTATLDPDRIYRLPVRARWIEDGITVEKSVTVKAFAGNRVTVNFVPPPAPPTPAAPVVRFVAPPPLPPLPSPANWGAPRSFGVPPY